MDKRFIYVFDISDREKLIAAGYKLITSKAESNVYVFENNSVLKFSNDVSRFVTSNVLMF